MLWGFRSPENLILQPCIYTAKTHVTKGGGESVIFSRFPKVGKISGKNPLLCSPCYVFLTCLPCFDIPNYPTCQHLIFKLYIYFIYIYIYIYIYIKQCVLPVITTMALWRLMHLGTWCTVFNSRLTVSLLYLSMGIYTVNVLTQIGKNENIAFLRKKGETDIFFMIQTLVSSIKLATINSIRQGSIDKKLSSHLADFGR